MPDNGRTGGPKDPLEEYRQALRRQNSAGPGSMGTAEAPRIPDERPAPEAPVEARETREAGELLAAEEPLDLGEPLPAEEPLDLGEPLAAEEPLELGEPLAMDEPLELGEPLELDQPAAAEESPSPGKPRSAADWLGLDEDVGPEDPLGLSDALGAEDRLDSDAPVALETAPRAAPEATQETAAADEDLPDDLQDTLARYQKAMSKLRASRSAEAADPLTSHLDTPDRPTMHPETAEGSGSELLDKYLKAVSRQRSGPSDAGGGSARAAETRTVSRETLNQFRKGRTIRAEAPVAEEPATEAPAPDFPDRPRAAPRARQRARSAPADAPGWGTRAVTFAVLLFAALPVQWLVYKHLGASFSLADLGAGLSALLPAGLILLLARPASGVGRLVMVVGSAAVALFGSAGFAYGLSLLQNRLPEGAGLLIGLLLTLGLFTAVWGPLFLILVPVLSRMSLPVRSKS